jgi:hypothetical protein
VSLLTLLVDVLDGTKQISLEDDEVQEAVAEMFERIDDCGEPDAIIPLKGATDLKLLH